MRHIFYHEAFCERAQFAELFLVESISNSPQKFYALGLDIFHSAEGEIDIEMIVEYLSN